MYAAYDDLIAAISTIDSSIPLYISDAWDITKAVRYIGSKNTIAAKTTCPLIIDTHLYWCFSQGDTQKTPRAIIADVSNKLAELNGQEGSVVDRGAMQVIVGEYSCVMAEQSWAQRGSTSQASLESQFGNTQSMRYQQRSGGSYFWAFISVIDPLLCAYASLMQFSHRVGRVVKVEIGHFDIAWKVGSLILLRTFFSRQMLYALRCRVRHNSNRVGLLRQAKTTEIIGRSTLQQAALTFHASISAGIVAGLTHKRSLEHAHKDSSRALAATRLAAWRFGSRRES